MDERPDRRSDGELAAALVDRVKDTRDRVSVFGIVPPSREASLSQAARLVSSLWPQFGDCSPFFVPDEPLLTQMRLPYHGRVDVFHPSGALTALMYAPASRTPIVPDEQKLDAAPYVREAEEHARTIAQEFGIAGDDLHLEGRFNRKGQGTSLPNENRRPEQTPVAVFEVLSSFRRHLDGLPVLGRASVHVGIGVGSEIIRWGADLRKVENDPFTVASVIDPEAGARRVLDELAWRRPERPCGLDDFEPKAFRLGYVSLGRRYEQRVMQPAWVAILSPRGNTTMGQVIAVPAAERAYEPIIPRDRGAGVLESLAGTGVR
jgi:hypothetical protein